MKSIITALFFVLTASLIFAHPPSDIKLSYDANTKVLTIIVDHLISGTKAADPVKHFVKDITISVNGKDIIVENIVFQQSDAGEKCSFLLNVKANDKVAVKANCNISGTKITEIVIK